MLFPDGRWQSRSASRLSQVTPREERPLLSSAGSDSESSANDDESCSGGDAEEFEGVCCPRVRTWLERYRIFGNRCKLLCSYAVGQFDQFSDGCVIVSLMDSGFKGWAMSMVAIVLVPQLLIWMFLYYQRMTSLISLGNILFFPSLVLAAVGVLCFLPVSAIAEDARWWLVHKAMFFVSFSLDPLYHLSHDWGRGQQDTGGWWAAIGEGVFEASCSSVFTIYITFLQKKQMDRVFMCSCIGSILSITKTVTELHLYGENPGLVQKVRFAVVYTFPHVVWRLLSLAMLAYLLRPASIRLEENRAELFAVFLLHEVLINSLILRMSIRKISRIVVLLFGLAMVVLGPPFFFSVLGHTRADHWIMQLISFLLAIVVALQLGGNSQSHVYDLWHNYRAFVIAWLIVTPWSAASNFCLWIRASLQAETAEKKAQSAGHKLVAAARAYDPILINLMIEVEGAVGSDALAAVNHFEIKIDRCGAGKWEGIAELNGSLYCAPRMAGEVLVVDSSTGFQKYWKLQEEGSYFGIATHGQKLYCGPADAHNVLVIDSKTDSLSTIPIPPRVVRGAPSRRWAGIAELNGMLYCAPSFADSVLVVDLHENRVDTRTLPDQLATKCAKFFGITAHKGKLYCCPRDANKVLVIEPGGEMSTIDLPPDIANDKNKWAGIAACGEKLYCAPLSAGGVLVIDPHVRRTDVVPLGSKGTGFYKWSGIAEYRGRLYCSPHNSTELLIIVPGGDVNGGEIFTYTPVVSTSYVSGRCSGIAVSEGKLFCCPCGLDAVLVVDPDPSFQWWIS